MKRYVLAIMAAISLAPDLSADEGTPFKAVGKLIESPSSHTKRHQHSLRFLRLSDAKEFDIIDSPELVKLHCETEKNPVLEVEGYRIDKILFWGGNVVVKSFKVHEDIEVPRIAHTVEPIRSSRGAALQNPRL